MNLSECVETEITIDQGKKLDDVLAELPTFPPGWVRLTHFTLENVAQLFIDGKDFDYGSQGIISSTTDSFSNDSLPKFSALLETDQVGPFNRSTFGDCVVLIDLEGREHKSRNGFYFEHTQVPNSNILGYVKIIKENENRRYIFYRNPKYSPVVNELKALPLPLQQISSLQREEQRQVEQVDSSPDDVW